MKILTPIALSTQGLVFPESPRWHKGSLWIADIFGDAILRLNERGETLERIDVPGARGIDFLPDGTLLFGTSKDGTLYRRDKGGVKPYANLNPFSTRGLNDMMVDSHGRAYVDAYRATPGMPMGSVVLVRPDGSVQEVAPEIATPNGLVITPDGKTLIVAQSAANELTAFTIRPDGSLTGKRTFAKLEGKPDGICLDAEGAVWVALFEDGKYIRVREGGEVTHLISMPGLRTAALMLGGPERRTLFLCASELHPERTRSKGSVHTIRVDVPGAGLP